MEAVETVIELANEYGVWWGLLILMLGAGIEYVFPPFPGDSVTIAGAVLIPTAGWPIWGVFLAVMMGSMIGGALDWRLGVWLAGRIEADDDSWLVRYMSREKVHRRYEWIIERFETHGARYLAVNRFLPVFRSFFFVAAGLARLRFRNVMFWSAVSAALWNAALMGLGYAVGYKIEDLVRFVGNYTTTVLVGLVVVFIGFKVFGRIQKRRAASQDKGGGEDPEEQHDDGESSREGQQATP